ncbi:CubicO group peptidase (beta-lactamase class C family) [Chryseobacterium ginsenosidimutans]|uniref:beta-lactamase family protein n=1 Tax=Chryseobacterium ginsenosidimutans TaxID=687846 RepID=UPI00216AABAF|nr:beta-lactamase family protein [Chryseobacterium ginsenosidimutans]MCS3870062.1 CubicO group peptidase (beta-lactamase class C family) [Chryseobacterium ginsenosidimutans]
MKQIILTAFFLNISGMAFSQQTEQSKLIDNYVKEAITTNKIPGLAIGIIKDDKIIFQQYYGTENLEDPKKVSSTSMFRVYSTSKLISSVGVFQLIEKGKLSLEDKVSKYVENLPKEWQNVKVKNLLSHSSGIPNVIDFNDILPGDSNAKVIDRLSKEKMDFETGNEFRYNQTNYLLLTMIIEKISGQTFEDFIIKNQFPDSKNELVFSSNSIEKIPNRIVKYNYNSTTQKYEKSTAIDGVRAHSGNGLAITLPAFLKWSSHLSKNDLLQQKTREMMWKPFDFSNKKSDFAYGWEITKTNNSLSYGFSGGNVSAYRIFPDKNMSIILMYNGYNFFPPQYNIVNHIAGIIDPDLINPYSLAEESIITEFSKKDNPNAEKNYYSFKAKNPTWDFESTLNNIGYILMRNSRIDEAVKVFELNVKEHPQSGGAFDSLGEGYLSAKNYKLALENYKKSIELDPQNTNGVNMINKIQDLMKKN